MNLSKDGLSRGYLLVAALVMLGFLALWTLVPQAAQAQVLSWSQVNDNGFGSASNQIVYSLVEYQSELYTGVSNQDTGAEIWRYDGTTWESAATGGLGDVNNIEMTALEVYDGKLFVGTTNYATGAEVWSYDGTDWTQVNTDGFGDVINDMPYDFIVFQDKLYTGVANFATGAEVWSYDGTDWTQVNTDGFGEVANLYGMGFQVYQDHLFMGTLKFDAGQGGELWEYDGTDWTQAGTDGFGDTNNNGIYNMVVMDNLMYIAVRNDTDGGEVWSYDGTDLVEIQNGGLGDVNNHTVFSLAAYNHKLFVSTTNSTTGGEVWSYDGTNWEQQNEDGFGAAANISSPMLTSYRDVLYAGTTNFATGTEIWQGAASDDSGPVVSGQLPADGMTGAALNTDINFSLTDEALEVDSISLGVTINGQDAITAGQFTDDFAGTIVSDGAWGFDVSINPDSDFRYGQSVEVVVTSSDVRGNQSTSTWSFEALAERPALGIVMSPASAGGPNIRVVSSTGTQISSFYAYDSDLRMGLEIEQADIDGDGVNEIVVTPGQGVESRIKAFELNGTEIASTLAFNAGFRGGVSLTTGDFNGDGREDIAVAPISGGGPNIRVYTLNAAGNAFELLDWFFAFQDTFRGGVNLTAGDIAGNDGVDELVVAPRGQGGPNLRVYHFNSVTGNFELVDWVMAYQDTFRGGVQLACGDINGDGRDDIIVSPYLNGGPNVRVYTLNSSSKLELLGWTMAYQSTYRGTLSMSVGDVNGDGKGEIILAPKSLGGPNVRIYTYLNGQLSLYSGFMVYQDDFRGGVNIFSGDVDGDGLAEVITSPASKGGPNVRVYDMETGSRVLKGWFWAFPEGFRGGVNFGK